MRFARIDTVTGAIGEFVERDVKPDDIPHKNIRWLPAPRVASPEFDPAAQVLDGPFYAVTDREVIESYTVRDKTAAELDADLDAKIDRVDQAVRKALEDVERRLTVLEGRQSRGFGTWLRGLFGR